MTDAVAMCMSADYPVRYAIEHPDRFTRLQLLVRVVAFCALGITGVSFGLVFAFAYIALPVFAASRLAVEPPGRSYVAQPPDCRAPWCSQRSAGSVSWSGCGPR